VIFLFANHFPQRVGLHGAGIARGNQHYLHSHARAQYIFRMLTTNQLRQNLTPGSETEQQYADGSMKLRMCGLFDRKPAAN
jgi:hypothetical protein